MPTWRRKVVVKWERLLNPARWQIWVTVNTESRRRSVAWSMRSRIRYR
jgi:hypothetical protein